ncbi:hypothetical protein K492DRAFT_214069 [Lichtheimia hyalospora FSU 10163]|nr:hypothetical protein K492DRAFT_214069 [Lichtheimia hyalospora FSU 10163]
MDIEYDGSEYISVPLKDCLMELCASCPDMLLYPDADCAVYSANFEEMTSTAESKMVWEGHGLLSWILDKESDKAIRVTGKRSRSNAANDEDAVEVVLQLHPVSKCDTIHYSTEHMYLLFVSSTPLHSSHALPSMLPTESLSPPNETSRYPRIRLSPEETSSTATAPPSHSAAAPTSSSPSSYDEHTFKKPPPSAAEASSSSLHHHHHHPYHHHPQQQQQQQPHYPHPQQHVRMPTQHTAVGRRKKRDTKPPNVNDVRTFVQVEKDDNGNYRLPVEIDSWTVLSLGDVIYDRPAFHNQRYIYPVGYKVKKWYRSMVDPRSDTQYTCEILDGGQEPIFRLEADDNPGEVYMGPTPTTVWTIAVRRAFAIRNMDYGHNPVGPDFFGLRKNTIAKMIQDLPNADKCKNYIWQTFKIGTTGRTAQKENSYN